MAIPLDVGVYLADQNPHRDRSLGISAVTQSLLNGLSADEGLRLTAWTSRSALRPDTDVPTSALPFRTDHALGRLFVDAAHPLLTRTHPDVWLYPKGFLSPLLSPSAPALVLVHDTILDHYARTYPGARSKASYAYWLGMLERSLRRAHRIATVSETSRRQIESFAARRAFALPPIEVVYAACAFDAVPLAAVEKDDYVLHLASNAPHKRTRLLLSAWRRGHAEKRPLPRLTLVGVLNDDLDTFARATPGVNVFPRQTRNALVELYRHARAVIVPSEIEGFGLPVLEAYALGTPACYTRGTSMEEMVRPFTDVGGFDLHQPASLWGALDDALALPPTAVAAIRTQLLTCYSKANLCRRVADALRRTADTPS